MTRPSNRQQKKKWTCRIMDSAIPADTRIKLKASEKRNRYLDLATELKKKKTMEHEGNGDTNCNWCTWNNTQRIGKETGNL